MKTTIRFAARVLAGGFLMLLMGCATLPTVTTLPPGAPTYPPTSPADVVILKAEPTHPWVLLGQIRVAPQGANYPLPEIEKTLKNAGAKLGADAVVIVKDRNQVVGRIMTGPRYWRTLHEIEGRVVIGEAIKYKQGVQ